MHRGFAKSWRKTEDSAVWKMPALYHRVWTWLLWKANHRGREVPMGKFGTVIVNAGQVVTSIDKIAEGVSYYQRNVKKKPNKGTIYRILRWFVDQEMIVIEKNCLTRNSRKPHEKRPKSNAPFTLITIVNWHIYQVVKEDESNAESNAQVTPEGHKQELRRIEKKVSCGNLEALQGLLASLPEFCDLPRETQGLITSFLDEARLSNKTEIITAGRVKNIFNELLAISGETSIESLNTALRITLQKAESGKFTFRKQGVTGYVKTIAMDQSQQAQKGMEEKYDPQVTDVKALYR